MVEVVENSPVLDSLLKAAETDILESTTVNADESAISLGKNKNYWVHLLVSPLFTVFILARNRGKEAMDAIGILPKFTGILVHDCWQTYFMFKNFRHCLCNAHIVRELNAAVEMGQLWAAEMIELLYNTLYSVECYGGVLPSG